MFMLHFGTPRDEEAREELHAVLPEAEVSKPDDVGVFEVAIDAEDQKDALRRGALAARGSPD